VLYERYSPMLVEYRYVCQWFDVWFQFDQV
jgi:hypothetical protein